MVDLTTLPELQNIAPNGTMASEEWTGNYVEGSSHDLILGTIPELS